MATDTNMPIFPSITRTESESFDYKSVSEIEGTISYNRVGHEEVQVGHVTLYIVDKKAVDHYDNEFWLDELLMKTKANYDDDLASVLRNVYDLEGEVEDAFNAYKAVLESDKVCYIHHFQLGKYYRHGGLGSAALQTILGTLPLLNDGHAFEGPCLLTPFVLDPEDCRGRTNEEKHEILCAFYGREGDLDRYLDGMLVGYQEIARTLMGRWVQKRVK